MPQLPVKTSDADRNTVQQFELELQWCIQQLEGALSTNKMSTKQGKFSPQALHNSLVLWGLTTVRILRCTHYTNSFVL